MADFTPFQQIIIKRYYNNQDAIQGQRLAEMVSELYLSAGKKREKVWASVVVAMQKLGVPQARIDHVRAGQSRSCRRGGEGTAGQRLPSVVYISPLPGVLGRGSFRRDAKMDQSSPPAVVLVSGGLDSAVALAVARADGFRCYALTVAYGQRHAVELDAARRVADALVPSNNGSFLSTSAPSAAPLSRPTSTCRATAATRRWRLEFLSPTSRAQHRFFITGFGMGRSGRRLRRLYRS